MVKITKEIHSTDEMLDIISGMIELGDESAYKIQ
jgi:hypothetical protein